MFSNPADYLVVGVVVLVLYVLIRWWVLWSIYWCDPRWDPPKDVDPEDEE
ncbi:MAG: hypothetical protein ACHQ9S_18730 [Candidatus Binatia bacterium]